MIVPPPARAQSRAPAGGNHRGKIRMMIQEITGTVAETVRLLGTHTLDPRDEKVFWDTTWREGEGTVWVLQGRFLATDYHFHFRHRGDYGGVQHVIAAIVANTESPGYSAARRALLPLLDAWLRIGNANDWIGAAWDPPFNEASFALCRDPAQLAAVVDRNNWSVGTAFVLADTDVCMIQQCDGPGEFLMIRGARAFDSWTTGPNAYHGARLAACLEAVARAALGDDGVPDWYPLVQGPAPDPASGGVHVAHSAAELARLLAV
jgi:hypothetical protein